MHRESTYASAAAPGEPPPCVDLNHTLILTRQPARNLSICSFLAACRGSLFRFGCCGARHISRTGRPASVGWTYPRPPYNETLVRDLSRQHLAGRTIVLCTGAAGEIAERIRAHLGIFDYVIASDGAVNLVGSRKREALEARFGRRGFDYIGDSRKDLAIGGSPGARSSSTLPEGCSVSCGAGTSQRPAACFKPQGKMRVRLWLRAIRVHQWAKNLLLFAPLALGHRLVLFRGGTRISRFQPGRFRRIPDQRPPGSQFFATHRGRLRRRVAQRRHEVLQSRVEA